jgi:hypothetical protein
VKTKVLSRFEKQNYMIGSMKDFKQIAREIAVVPTYASEYKAQNVYKQVLAESPKAGMEVSAFFKALYLLISVSTSPADVFGQGPGVTTSEEDLETLQQIKRLQENAQRWPADLLSNPDLS